MRKKKNGRFLRRAPQKEDMALQITSMADIFTIILVFLLKSFSTGLSNVTPSGEVMLPEAKSTDEAADVLKVEISPTAILLDEKVVTALHSFHFDNNDLESDGTPRSLNAALIREKDRAPAAANAERSETDGGRLMVLADQNAPYGVVKTVMDSAANHGFADFKLVVVEER